MKDIGEIVKAGLNLLLMLTGVLVLGLTGLAIISLLLKVFLTIIPIVGWSVVIFTVIAIFGSSLYYYKNKGIK